MNKLRLNLDGLSVETFDTTVNPASARGTVRGNTGGPTCDRTLCASDGAATCGGLCTYNTCPPMTYEYNTCGEGNATETCGPATDNTGCGQATCGNGTCAVNTCPAETA